MTLFTATLSALLLALPVFADSVAPGNAAISISQTTTIDGNAVEPPLVGVGAPPSPTVPFHVTLRFECPAGTERGRLFVSIADTALVEDAPPGASEQTVRLDVPLRQLQWLAEPGHHCDTTGEQRPPDDIDAGGARFIRLHAGAAAYASVSCRAREVVVSSATSSAPLDVWLSCSAAEVPPTP
jgi:hypothetical protein